MIRTKLPVALIASACLAWLGFVVAAPVNDRKVKESTADGVRRVLDQPTSMEFNETPLQVALNQLGEQNKLNIVLDRAAAMQTGNDPTEMPVTLRLKDAKLKSGLRSMLAQYGMTYAVIGDMVLVTAEETANHRLMRQSIDVDIDNQPLGDSLRRLARSAGVNLVVDPRQAKAAQTSVTLKLDDVSFESAVRILAELAGMRPVRMGNVLFVTSEERADRLRGEAGSEPLNPMVPSDMAVPKMIGAGIQIIGGNNAVPLPPPPVAPPAKPMENQQKQKDN